MDMIQIRNGSSGILVMSGRNKKQVIWRFCSSADCVFSYNRFERERCENVIEKECVENVGRKIKRVSHG